MAHDSFARIDLPLIDRYFAGTASDDERATMMAALERDPALRELMGLLQATGREAPDLQLQDVEVAWRRDWERMRAESSRLASRRTARVATTHVSTRALKLWTGSRVTSRASLFATLSAMIIIAGVYGIYGGERPIPTRRYQTLPGRSSTIRLHDGSMMTLAPATSATVTARDVEIVGEAYFSVVPHVDHPFVVHTRNSVVRVLGTRFSVRQYPTDRASVVMVEQGRVALQAASRGGRESVLAERTAATVTDSMVTVTRNISVPDYTGWIHGRLDFKDVALGHVASELSRVYGTNIEIADSTLAKMTMTMEIAVNEQPLVQVLDLIGKAANAHYTRRGERYLLLPGRAVSKTPAVRQRVPSSQQEKLYGK